MKTASCAMQAHLKQGQTSTAWLWKVKRVDGTILAFGTHDQDIVYDNGDGDGPLTYEAATGFDPTAQSNKSDLSPDNAEVTGFLESSSLTETDIRAHLYDYCQIKIMLVNWADLTMGHVLIRSGTSGQIKMKNGLFTADLRGISAKLENEIGEMYGPICRATFGSGLNGIDMDAHYLCMVDVTLYRQNGSVSSAPDPRTIVPNSGLLMVGSSTPTNPAPDGWFDDGFLTFTSGALNGQSFEIREWDGTTLSLYLPMEEQPAASDTFSIEPGCNHTMADCADKFNNAVNMRAEIAIPGTDQLALWPNDG